MKTSKISIILIIAGLIGLTLGYTVASANSGYFVIFIGYPLLIAGIIIGIVIAFLNRKNKNL